MDLLTRYFGPIKQAVVVFPLIAGFFTLPYLLHEYRKYGAILFLRTLMVYSFILYMMCASRRWRKWRNTPRHGFS